VTLAGTREWKTLPRKKESEHVYVRVNPCSVPVAEAEFPQPNNAWRSLVWILYTFSPAHPQAHRDALPYRAIVEAIPLPGAILPCETGNDGPTARVFARVFSHVKDGFGYDDPCRCVEVSDDAKMRRRRDRTEACGLGRCIHSLLSP